VRVTLPNVGGIAEMLKIAAICETHFVGIVPHFTGPLDMAQLKMVTEITQPVTNRAQTCFHPDGSITNW